jgi:predicted RNase H-like nuclease/predicted enzyme related to lactoylglutathione lyase
VGSTRLDFIALRVRDVAASTRFYADAFGVSVDLRPAVGEATRNAELGLVVDDLGAAHARAVAAGAVVVVAPDGTTATYRDPEGNLVTLTQPAPSPRVAGVDLARGALAVAVLEGGRIAEAYRVDSIAEALLVDAQVVGIDIPIGIPDAGVRPCDAAARRFIGPRAASVFTTPLRSVLEAATYEEARRIAVELTGKSISAQSYALRHRILEVDEYAGADDRVIEVHPEVSFRELAHRPLLSKHRADGLAERRALLEEAGLDVPLEAPRLAEPDLLDASIAAWSAERYARGEALPLPEGHAGRLGAIWR